MLFLSQRQVGVVDLDLYPLGRCIQYWILEVSLDKGIVEVTQMRFQFWVMVKTSTRMIVLHETTGA